MLPPVDIHKSWGGFLKINDGKTRRSTLDSVCPTKYAQSSDSQKKIVLKNSEIFGAPLTFVSVSLVCSTVVVVTV